MSRRPRQSRISYDRKSLQLEALEKRELLAIDTAVRPPVTPPPPPAGGTVQVAPVTAGAQTGQGAQTPLTPRKIDGTGNNVAHPDWGSSNEQFLRKGPAAYGDGVSTAAGQDRASPRAISNIVSAQDGSMLNSLGWSDMLWQWGQFLDHDLDLTDSATPAESLPISIPTGDPSFDPTGSGSATMSFSRSAYDSTTGTAVGNPRQQMNSITAFIDGSMVYGSDDARAAGLRTMSGGKLRTSDGNLLPLNTTGLPNAGGTDPSLFVAGDIRVNEQVGLVSIQTLWVREHNRLADQIAKQNPTWTDEQIYQKARSIVIGEIQKITYSEFLPALLGPNAISQYRGYNPNVNPGITNEFATAAFRVGHTLLSPELLRLDNNGNVIADGNLTLRESFFNIGEIKDNGVDSLLKGLSSQRSQELDENVIDDVRNFLFGPPGAGGLDLASLNIQRGRDHGLGSYNQTRVAYGLKPATSFADITKDTAVQAQLSQAYGGDVNKVDLWVGGLAEDGPVAGAMGQTFHTILVDQFTRLRDGDRYWYQNSLSGADLQQVERTTLADVIKRNSTITNLQQNVFFAPGFGPNQGQQNPPVNPRPAPGNGGGHHTPPPPALLAGGMQMVMGSNGSIQTPPPPVRPTTTPVNQRQAPNLSIKPTTQLPQNQPAPAAPAPTAGGGVNTSPTQNNSTKPAAPPKLAPQGINTSVNANAVDQVFGQLGTRR